MSAIYTQYGAVQPFRFAQWFKKYGNKDLAVYVHGENTVETVVDDNEAGCKIEGFPAQCGMLIACFIYGRYKSPEMDKLIEVVEGIALALNYSAVMYTMPTLCVEFTETMHKHGYKEVFHWYNRRSRNSNYVFVKELPEE